MKYVLAFVIGGSIFTLSLAAFAWVEGNHAEHLAAQTPPPTPPSSSPQSGQTESQSGTRNNQQEQNNSGGTNTQQSSTGDNSPNIAGDKNRVSIYTGPIYSAPKNSAHEGGFREDDSLPKTVTLLLGGENGMSATMSVDQLKLPLDKQPKFININGFVPFRARIQNGVIVCDVKIWVGNGVSPIEIKGNKFVVDVPGWDRNFTDNAFEVVNESRLPVFQVIRKTRSTFIFKGYLFTPNFVLIANEGVQPVGLNDPLFTQPIPRIFKYPSWKYPGQYADDK